MEDYLTNEKFTSTNLKNLRGNMSDVWSGLASSQLGLSFDEAITAVEEIKSSIATFETALDLLEKYIENETSIKNYENAIEQEQTYPSLQSSETYTENGVQKTRTIYVVNQAKIDSWRSSITTLQNENIALKAEIEGILASIMPVNLQPKNNTDIAHRGYHPGGIYENSLDAFIEAGKMGFWGAEADVIQDPNGNLVCSHNAVKPGENPPSFADYLDVCKEYGMTAVIDMKYSNGWSTVGDDALVNQILSTIQEKGMMDSCVIQTNNPNDVINVRNNSEDARIWYLGHNSVTDKDIELGKEYGVECINFNSSENNAYRIRKVTEAGMDACVWNVQTERGKEICLNLGAKYVMSDNLLGITPYQEGEEDVNNIVN